MSATETRLKKITSSFIVTLSTDNFSCQPPNPNSSPPLLDDLLLIVVPVQGHGAALADGGDCLGIVVFNPFRLYHDVRDLGYVQGVGLGFPQGVEYDAW